ncbi:hypothetical protein G7046_g4216 [Stylonectria norvegica]|nr:hypothetical protein G7046_g4216 [Stylonectria norvegica]
MAEDKTTVMSSSMGNIEVSTERPGLKHIAGRLITASNIKPPNGWTDDYEEMGGEYQWGKDGVVAELAETYGIDGTVTPHFAMSSSSGEALGLFEAGTGQYYLWNAIDCGLWKITKPQTLGEIVSTIDTQGLGNLELKEL